MATQMQVSNLYIYFQASAGFAGGLSVLLWPSDFPQPETLCHGQINGPQRCSPP